MREGSHNLKGWAVSILLAFIVNAGFGQTVRFSSFFDSNNGAGLLERVVRMDNGNLMAVGSNLNPANGNRQDGHHVVVDSQGNLLSEYEIVFPGMTYNTQSLIQTSSGSIFSSGYFCDYTIESPGYCDFYFARLDETGDTLFTKVIERPDTSELLLSMVETRPNKIMLIGWTYNDTTDADADLLFITVDTLGNELNRVVFGGGGTDYVHSACLKDNDGNVMMTGYTLSFGAGSGKSWVLQTDSIGNVEWYEIYTGLSAQGDGGIGISRMSSDGSFVVVGGSNYPNESDAYMMKIEPNGDEIWRKRYQIPDNQGLYKAEELADGTIVAAGQTTHTHDDSQAGWLIKTDENGDTLWTRTYNPSDGTDLLRNMLVMPNGDIVMVGFGRGENSTTQDGWILRVDSMGCLEEGCHTVGISPPDPPKGVMEVYPNPASQVVRLDISTLPNTGIQRVSVVDVLGRDCFSRSSFAMTDVMDVSAWPDGIYLITVTDEDGNRYTERLVVQH